jgi:hypothetical protein
VADPKLPDAKKCPGLVGAKSKGVSMANHKKARTGTNSVGNNRTRKICAFELAEAFAALDRQLTEIGIKAELMVTSAGFVLMVDPDDPITMVEERHLVNCITDSIARVANLNRLPDDWPRQLSQLFPREFIESWDFEQQGLCPLGVTMLGESLEVVPTEPESVLVRLLFLATHGYDIPEGIWHVARAAGCEDIGSIQSAYNAGFSEYPLTNRILLDLILLKSREAVAND